VGPVELILSFSIPAVPIALVAVGAWELRRHRQGKQRGTPLSATYINEFTAIFYGTKRMELDHRESMSMMREEDAQAAPPGFDGDLDNGIVVPRNSTVSGGSPDTAAGSR
jgi:hypothetical protein